jgi:hypothetical protein
VRVENGLRRGGLAAIAVGASLAAGCGGETTDVSQGVSSINKDLARQHVRLGCPKTVDGGAGAVFTCTLTNTRNHKSTKMKLKVVKQGDKLAVAPANSKEYPNALARIGAA